MKATMKFSAPILIPSLLALVAGLAIGYFSGNKESSLDSARVTERSLRALSEADYQEYLALKDSPEKLRKADELLGKVMQLVLADIGIASGKRSAVPLAADAAPTLPGTVKAAAKTDVIVPPRKWLDVEQKVVNGNSETEVLEALKGVELADIFHELRSSQSLSNDQLRQINGKYTGEITFYDGSEPWHVEWVVTADFKNGLLSGKQDIKLSKSGTVFSHSSNDGTLKDFTAASGASKALFVKTNGDAGYMQLWEANALQRLAGVYILKENLDQFKAIGTVNLQRSP
jgi:hypothetical protein